MAENRICRKKLKCQETGNISVVVVVVLTLTRKINSVVTRHAPVTLELRNTLAEKLKP